MQTIRISKINSVYFFKLQLAKNKTLSNLTIFHADAYARRRKSWASWSRPAWARSSWRTCRSRKSTKPGSGRTWIRGMRPAPRRHRRNRPTGCGTSPRSVRRPPATWTTNERPRTNTLTDRPATAAPWVVPSATHPATTVSWCPFLPLLLPPLSIVFKLTSLKKSRKIAHKQPSTRTGRPRSRATDSKRRRCHPRRSETVTAL